MYNKNVFLRMSRSSEDLIQIIRYFKIKNLLTITQLWGKPTKECKRQQINNEILEVTKPKIKGLKIICKCTIWTDLHSNLHGIWD